MQKKWNSVIPKTQVLSVMSRSQDPSHNPDCFLLFRWSFQENFFFFFIKFFTYYFQCCSGPLKGNNFYFLYNSCSGHMGHTLLKQTHRCLSLSLVFPLFRRLPRKQYTILCSMEKLTTIANCNWPGLLKPVVIMKWLLQFRKCTGLTRKSISEIWKLLNSDI